MRSATGALRAFDPAALLRRRSSSRRRGRRAERGAVKGVDGVAAVEVADVADPGIVSKGGSRSWQIQARCNLLERGPLGRADVLPALSVSVGDPVREVEHEPLVVLKLLRRCLTLEQTNRIAKMLQTLFLEFLDRVVSGVVSLGLR